jgi:hypothetical protein
MKYLSSNATNNLFLLLPDLALKLAYRKSSPEVESCIGQLIDIYRMADQQDSRDAIVTGLVISICPLYANGLGDAVIWPALRKAGLHREAETFTEVTNKLRAELFALLPSSDEVCVEFDVTDSDGLVVGRKKTSMLGGAVSAVFNAAVAVVHCGRALEPMDDDLNALDAALFQANAIDCKVEPAGFRVVQLAGDSSDTEALPVIKF